MVPSMAFTGNNDLIEIEKRNRLRAEAGLPLPSAETEMRRLQAARDQAALEREFERRRPEIRHQWIGNRDGWLTNMGRWSLARQQVREEMRKGPNLTLVNLIDSTPNLLVSQGYRLRDDTWNEHGRRTYIHDDDVARSHITSLSMVLKSTGWRNDSENLFSFVHHDPGESIEIEPSGPDTSGHFLHHMRAFD
jgi:hypothetical protein